MPNVVSHAADRATYCPRELQACQTGKPWPVMQIGSFGQAPLTCPVCGGPVQVPSSGTLFSYAYALLPAGPPPPNNGPGAYNLGMHMTTDLAGHITQILFWKDPTDTGQHIGNIWRESDQTLLGQVTFTNETPSGWQAQALATPIAIVPGQTYRVAVTHANVISYYIGAPQIDAGPLHILPGGVLHGANAVVYPDAVGSDNYMTDVGFVVP